MINQPDEPWHPDMANGCSSPKFGNIIDWALRLFCQVCEQDCNEHDEWYYNGGDANDKLVGDIILSSIIVHKMVYAGEPKKLAVETAAAVFHGLQTPLADLYFKWKVKPPERGPQET